MKSVIVGGRLEGFVHTVKLLVAAKRTIREIADVAGIHPETVRRYVTLLQQHGLVEPVAFETRPGLRGRARHMGRAPMVFGWKARAPA